MATTDVIEIIEQTNEIIEVVTRGPAAPPYDPAIGIPDNHIPMILDGDFADSTIIVENQTLVVGLGSLQYGEAHRSSSAGENVITNDLVTGISYHPVWQTPEGGNTAVVRDRAQDLPDITIAADELDIVNPTWSQGASSGDQTVRKSVFMFPQNQTNVKLIIKLDGIAVVSILEPQISAGLFTFNFLGHSSLHPSGFDLRENQVVSIEMSSDDGDVIVRGSLLGGNLIPYQLGTICLWEDKTVALKIESQPVGKFTPTQSGYLGGQIPIISRLNSTDISIGGGIFNYFNDVDTTNIVEETKIFTGISSLTLTTAPPNVIAYIYLDLVDLTIKETINIPAIEPNSWVYLGNVDFDSGDIIANSFIETAYSPPATSKSLMFSHGDYNLMGCDYYGVGLLSLGHTEGIGVRLGGNTSVNLNDPDRVTSAADSISIVVRTYINESGELILDYNSSDIDPSNYSKNGVLTPVKAAKWSIQYLYHFYGSDVALVYYGTQEYGSIEDARSGITIPPLDVHNITSEAVLRSVILSRGGATDLTLEADAIILNL